MNVSVQALLAAVEAHQGQKRKDGKPYIQHPIRVVDYITQYSDDIELHAAGYLHDVKEDTTYNIEYLFNDRINFIVDLVTKRNGESKVAAMKRVGTMWESTFLKMCDRLDNFSEMNEFTDEYFNRKSVQESTCELLNLANKHHLTDNIIYKTLYQMINKNNQHIMILQ